MLNSFFFLFYRGGGGFDHFIKSSHSVLKVFKPQVSSIALGDSAAIDRSNPASVWHVGYPLSLYNMICVPRE